METSLAEDVKKPTRTLSPDSFFFMSPYRSLPLQAASVASHSLPLAAMR
ncbi:isochorismate synthase [Klebsiella pneumoniae]|nr:isochorismate synthase [Klebsiella pneumoniae]